MSEECKNHKETKRLLITRDDELQFEIAGVDLEVNILGINENVIVERGVYPHTIAAVLPKSYAIINLNYFKSII